MLPANTRKHEKTGIETKTEEREIGQRRRDTKRGRERDRKNAGVHVQ